MSTDPEDTVTMPAQEEPGPGDGRSAALTALKADCDARTEEVDQEQTYRAQVHAEADAAFGIEMDADVAIRRQRVAAYVDEWVRQIHAYCDEAQAINGGLVRNWHARRDTVTAASTVTFPMSLVVTA